MSRGNEPAYPIAYNFGMTLREHYAGLAMAALIGCPNGWDADDIAGAAWEQADALLSHRLTKDPTP